MPFPEKKDLTPRQRLLASVFARSQNFSMRSLRDRIVVQKTVYFVQQFGLFLGYGYSWYVYGPYSPSLANDAFAIAAQPLRREPLPENVDRVVERLREFLGDRSRDAVWLEALGSLHILSKMYPDSPRKELVQRVLNKAPYFKRSDCEQAWQHLVAHGQVKDTA